MKKQIPLLLSAILIVGLLYLFDVKITMPSLATDSGFDTSYDSGGSSGSSWDSDSSSSSSDSSWGSSSSSSSSGGHRSGKAMSPVECIIYLLIWVGLPMIIAFCFMSKEDKIRLILYPFAFVFVCSILVPIYMLVIKIHFVVAIIATIAMLYLPFALPYKIVSMIVDKEPMFKTKKLNINNQNNKIGSFTNRDALALYYKEKNNHVPKTEKNAKLLDNCYEIFKEVQHAWMNFDYEKLRTLVTDELYNSYYNQLQTLELKGQKNIMNNFYLIETELLRLDEEDGVWTILMRLEVEFNDYIVDSDNKVIRGSSRDKVLMNYLLTFVEDENAEEKCPHCGAKLGDGVTICSYCKAHIQALTQTLKLSKKEAISQKPGRKCTK